MLGEFSKIISYSPLKSMPKIVIVGFMKNNAAFLKYGFFLLLSSLLLLSLVASAQDTLTLDYKITGVSDPALSNALQRLRDIQTRYAKTLTPEAIIRLYKQGPQQIKAGLQPFGYFTAKVKGQLKHQGNQWVANYRVTPGPRVQVNQLDLLLTGPGADNAQLNQFISHYPLKKGDPLLTKPYDEAKQKFFEIAQNQGYLDAQITQSEIQVDIIRQQAHIIMHFDTGPRYYFGPVHFKTKVLSQKFLQRFVPFNQGQPYSSDSLLKLQDDLSSSPYFNQVLISPNRQETEDQQVPILVQLKPRPSQQYDFGSGYGTDTGPRGSLGIQLRRLTETGQRFNTDLKASPINKSLITNYIFPGRHPSTDEYRIFAGIGSDERGRGTSNTKQVGTSYTNDVAGWQQTIKLTYQLESFCLTPDSLKQHSQLLLPSIAWSRVKADNLIYPQNGYSSYLTIRTAVDDLISDNRFVQARLQYKWIHSYGQNSRLLLQTDLGYTVADDPDSLPLSVRFYSGGAKNIRGYNYQDLGPGRYLVEASVEYQHRIKGNWHGAVFYDTGNAFNNFNEGLKRGVGIGLVWASPIGPINLSLAKALDSENKPLRLQFSMGPDL
ncbi:MAG: yrdA [Gammaproteobacteria bacterium]|jgi:translocation and assembly module TamA|nr:yrdA [Gammaproteobacteria bacterium]